MKIIKKFLIGIFCLSLLIGCYSNLEWAKENGLLYHIETLNSKEWSKLKYPFFGLAGYKGAKFNVHMFIFREEWCWKIENTNRIDCNHFLFNHEWKHVRFTDWEH